ncbi:hypothetical protein ACH4TX_41735 [Streptomyces sp. NPDC021098]|uniref:hypothetical protein n=1 Tax=unclassified Streptomyces TaxID=2593676 RepID=UPI0037A2A522
MKKSTLAEAATVITSGAVASGIGHQLADHHVPTPALVTAVMAILASGLYLAHQISQGLRTTYYTCPAKGCDVSIRARDTSQAELNRLRTLATDHSKHGPTA